MKISICCCWFFFVSVSVILNNNKVSSVGGILVEEKHTLKPDQLSNESRDNVSCELI